MYGVGQQPELMELKNPYDTSYLLANAIPYLADYAYYEGKYYVYFGIVPELLFYLPCLALTGRGVSEFPRGMVLLCGFCRFRIRIVPGGCETVVSPDSLRVLPDGGRGDAHLWKLCLPGGHAISEYHVPLMAANMFTAAGIWLWLCGLNRERGGCRFFSRAPCVWLLWPAAGRRC